MQKENNINIEKNINIPQYVWQDKFYSLEEFLRLKSCLIQEYNTFGTFGDYWVEYYPVDYGDNFLVAGNKYYDQCTGDEIISEIFILEKKEGSDFDCMESVVQYCLDNKDRIIYCKDYEDFF